MSYKHFDDMSDDEKRERCKDIFWDLRNAYTDTHVTFVIFEILNETRKCQPHGFDFERSRKLISNKIVPNTKPNRLDLYFDKVCYTWKREEICKDINNILKKQDPVKYYFQRFQEIIF